MTFILADDPVLGGMPETTALLGLPTFSLVDPVPSTVSTNCSTSLLPLPAVTSQSVESSNSPSLAIPPKLLKRILNLEFIEMIELVPESWGVESESAASCCHQVRPQPRRGPVTNILLWLECYSSLVAALATKYPQYTGEFMAYQRTIIKASRNFEGTAWVLYDRAFRRRAAATKDLKWGRTDSALYNESFTGRAHAIARCHLCLGDTHFKADCPDRAMALVSQNSVYSQASYSSQGKLPQRGDGGSFRGPLHMAPTTEVCQLFNQVRCRATWCKRRHICNHCALPHPVVVCPTRPHHRERSRSPHRQKPARAK